MNKILIVVALVSMLALGACGSAAKETPGDAPGPTEAADTKQGGHAEMHHSGLGKLPDGLRAAESPTYPVGSQAVIADAHMSGMEGAEVTIAGAYDTTAYIVSYTPTDGGEPVVEHKWVVHEELEGAAGKGPLAPGEEAVLAADHLPGMAGATATIDAVEQTTVYSVDFISTTTGEEVKGHLWVTEEELAQP
ncbi:hypothetical protein PA598K_03593 [Paenibacillus sp. 598K]|uniref:YdhK family protein n=1 Tax=Paenibacillus sp. 598K TaxID=1117987 RepID=UPI000FFA8F8D|nr:YdhK family protein [Paenibacillus sp. 598K]GBF75204.1 hypothetical protein PA598K_03593 [Paenibacillus sp. 598K]